MLFILLDAQLLLPLPYPLFSYRRLRVCRSSLLEGLVDLCELFGRKPPAACASGLADLIGPLCTTYRGGNARLMDRPIDHKLGDAMARGSCDVLKSID